MALLKSLKLIDELSIGSFSGTMDDITNGTTYVKTENNLTDALAGNLHAPETATSIATIIGASTEQTVLADANKFPLVDGTTLKHSLLSTIKSTLKTYFDGLYLALTGGTLTGGLTITPATDAVNVVNVNDKDSNVILSVDTVNNRAGVGVSTPTGKLEIVGNTNTKASDIDNIIACYALNLSQGFAIRYDGIYAIGSNTIVDLKFYSKGTNSFIWLGNAINDGLRIRYNDALNTIWNADNPISITANSGQKIYLSQTSTPAIGLTVVTATGNTGIKTTAPDKSLEINSADGNCLRLTYNDANGSATYYVDFNVSAAGLLTINASGGIIKTANDIEITDTTKGIILTSPDTSRWRVTIGDDGVLTTTKI